jgi:hypothetical protein
MTGFPTPLAVPLKIFSRLVTPREKTFTRMFPLYDGWNDVSPPTVGMPMQLP